VRRLRWLLLLVILTACHAAPAAPASPQLYALHREAADWALVRVAPSGELTPLLAEVDAFAPGPTFAVVLDVGWTVALWEGAGAPRAIAQCTAACHAVTWSANGEWLAWLEGDAQGGALWAWERASGRVQLLGEALTAPMWSPVGATLAFGAAEGLTFWEAESATFTRMPFTTATPPSWDPAGGRVAVVLGGHEVVFASPGVPFPQPLLLEIAAGAVWTEGVAWSPDGAYLALLQRRFNPPPHDHDEPTDDRQGSETLGAQPWLYDMTTGTLTPLPGDPGAVFAQPRWSPDGAQVAVTRIPIGVVGGAPEVWLFDAATGVRQAVFEGLAAPAWGP